MAVIDFGLRLGREYGTKSWMWKRPPPKSLPTDAESYFTVLAEALGALPTNNNGQRDFRRAWLTCNLHPGGPKAELDRLATAHPAHQEERYRAGVKLVAGILRQLADEVEGVVQ